MIRSLLLLLLVSALPAQVAVRADLLHTAAGEPIVDAVVVVTDGTIAAIGPAAEVAVPDGYRVLEAKVVTPGLIDARATAGLAGWLNQQQDRDELDRTAPIQPELRALDAYDAREPLVAWLRGHGITTLHTGHAPGALISGQTILVKTGPGSTVDANLLRAYAMLSCSLGSAAKAKEGAPGNRAKAVAMLRQRLVDAQRYRDARQKPGEDPVERDLGLDALVEVLDGRVPLLVYAQREQDLLAALRIQQEFGIRLVLDGAAESYRLLERIKQAGVPVLAHPPMIRPKGDAENARVNLGTHLRDAGIAFAYQSGYENYVPRTRVVLFEAAMGGAYGLGFDGALRAITIDAARILDIDDRVGSIEVGKDGDLALFDSDPFEHTSHCIGVLIDGVLVSEQPR